MVIGLVTLSVAAVALGQSPCADLLVAEAPSRAARAERTVSVDDLVRLRDIGPFGAGLGAEHFLAVSPDQRHVAFELRRADPATNLYCVGLVVLDLESGAVRLIDQGSELILLRYTHDGLKQFQTGVPQAISPSWSPDGRWLAILRRSAGTTQVWRIRADGSAAEQLTHETQDVTATAFSADGRRLVYRTDRAVPGAALAIDAEGLGGWHYDARFLPLTTTRPFSRTSDEAILSLDLATRAIANASPEDRAHLDADATTSIRHAALPGGRQVTVAAMPRDPRAYQSPQTLRWRDGATERVCQNDPCAQARAFWIAPDGASVLLLARSGWGGGDMRFYRWTVRTGHSAPLFETADLLLGCRPLRHLLLCAREAATRPRRLVLLDPATGRSRTIYDPNPAYDRLRQGRVERLRLTSASGTHTFADVMYPPDFVAGRRYPMVVVQYESRGFLRGGTGNEYPIPALAAAGMIVLSFERTVDVAATAVPPPTSDDAFNRIDFTDWADRRNVQSALMDGVEQMIAKGVVDERRIGITGLSDGVGTAAFALLHSHRFSVAALSGCCEEPVGDMVLQGPAFTRMMRAAGYPPYGIPDPDFWRPYALAQNAARISAPILVQAPDRELLFSLPTVEALRDQDVPVDLYVFPNEFHVKWQPAHRAAIFERVLRWFEFWFDLPPLPTQIAAPADEAAQWRAFKALRQSRAAAPPDPE